MEQFVVYSFRIDPFSEDISDMLCALLGDLGFDSFEQTSTGVEAYIAQGNDDEGAVSALLQGLSLGSAVTFSKHALENKNWNEQWEKEGFRPIVIDGLCAIHRPADAVPALPYDILIEPRMAFGSGTHETTSQLVEMLLGMDFSAPNSGEKKPSETSNGSGIRALDMGCGTGILALAMHLRGAQHVVAIDIDESSVENTRHNAELNGIRCGNADSCNGENGNGGDAGSCRSSADSCNGGKTFEVIHGDASAIDGQFDVIVANIHRNIIIHDLPTYAAHLAPGGTLIVSGFFTEDAPAILSAAAPLSLRLHSRQSRNNWCVLRMVKE